MKKNYLLSFPVFLLITSCAARINYLGSTYTPTQQVDVYVNEASIKNNYDVIGKGYVSGNVFARHINKLQNKSVEVAKKKGADAVLIGDYYIPNTGSSIQTTAHVDSIGKGVIAISNSNIQSTGTTAFTIYFLKYRK